MTDHKYDRERDRQVLLSDIKSRLILLQENTQLLPIPDIYDEPLRYFKANKEWWKIISGWLSHLEAEYGWILAEDEAYSGIQQLLKFEEGIEIPMADFDCGDVEDCLGSSEVINEIIQEITNFENGTTQEGNPANTTKDPTTGSGADSASENSFEPVDCSDSDKDKLWAAIDSLIDFVHATNTDLFELIEGYTSKADLLAIGIGAIPILGLFTADESIQFLTAVADYVGVQYRANVTTESLYQLKCDLFCQAIGVSCYFSVEDAYGYFISQDGLVAITEHSTIADYLAIPTEILTITGMETFCFISALQLSLASLNESFVVKRNMRSYTRAAQAGALSPDSGWKAWCDDCASHSGEWTVIIDFANDYVASGDEYVYRNMFTRLVNVSGNQATLTQKYGDGATFTSSGSQTVRKRLSISNAALCKDISANVRKVSGVASFVGILFNTDAYAGQPRRNFNSGSFGWTTAVPLANVGGTSGVVNHIDFDLNTTLISQAAVADIRYLKITGTGNLPQFT